MYGAEMDIFEFFKKLGTDIVSHNVHWAYGPNQRTTRGMQSYLKGVSEGFHDFALEWTPEKYVFFVDGYKFYEVTNGLSHIEEYLILSMEIPSEAKEIKDTIFPDAFIVDYVKVYQKKPNPRLGTTPTAHRVNAPRTRVNSTAASSNGAIASTESGSKRMHH